MNKKISAFLIVCFLAYYSFSQSKKFNSEHSKTISIDSCLSWMRQNAYTGKDLDNFHVIGLQTLKRSLETKNYRTIAEVHEELANWHGYNGIFSPDSIVYNSEKAESFIKMVTIKRKLQILTGHFL